jgi:N-methylhydantoinase B
VALRRGDVVCIETPGAGGYGVPGERSRERVVWDVLEGKLSSDAAQSAYGVVPLPDELTELSRRRE